jgi:hypothetical protein
MADKEEEKTEEYFVMPSLSQEVDDESIPGIKEKMLVVCDVKPNPSQVAQEEVFLVPMEVVDPYHVQYPKSFYIGCASA